MESTIPGFVTQLKGGHNKRHYKCAAIIVDNLSFYVHVDILSYFLGNSLF